MIRMRLRWQLLLVVAAALVARGVVAMVTLYQVDDAMITFRYAENLAAGHGFVYNAGEHVLGTTSPLWTLILALTALLHANVPATALWISLICSGMTAGAVYCLARALGSGRWALLAGLVYALNPRSVTVDICGLEVALFTFLTVTSLHRLRRGRSGEALLYAAFAALTRPEGALLFLSIAGLIYFQRRRVAIVDWLLALVPLAAWVVFASLYFSSPVPNSLVAKAGLYGHDPIPLLQRLAQMLSLTNPAGWLLWIGALLAIILGRNQRSRILVLAGIILGIALPVAAFSLRIFFWYPAPLLPLLIILAVCGISRFSSQFSPTQDSRRVKLAVAVVVILLLVAAVPVLAKRAAGLQAEMQWYRVTHIAAAEYLVAHAGPNDSVIAEDIGHFGYHYRRRIVDRDGLVTPQAIPYNKTQRYFEFVDSVDADWLLLAVMHHPSSALLEQPRFHENYRPVDSEDGSSNPSHRLYRRQSSGSVP